MHCTEATLRSLLKARGWSETKINLAVAQEASIHAKFDARLCHSCGGEVARTLNPDQESQNTTDLPGAWYLYTCAACGWSGQRKEEGE
jgi:broad-specificity NMP kinase